MSFDTNNFIWQKQFHLTQTMSFDTMLFDTWNDVIWHHVNWNNIISIIWQNVSWHNVIWNNIDLPNVIWHSVIWHNVIWCDAIWCRYVKFSQGDKNYKKISFTFNPENENRDEDVPLMAVFMWSLFTAHSGPPSAILGRDWKNGNYILFWLVTFLWPK